MVEIARFSENLAIKHHHGIGSQHKITPEFGGNGHGLEIRIGQNKITRRKTSGQLLNIGRYDVHIKTGVCQQIPPSRRG